MTQDIFLRAHTVSKKQKPKGNKKHSAQKWADRVLVFDTETTTDTREDLLFGGYRLCERHGDVFLCLEEGLFHADDLDPAQLEILKRYAHSELADSEIKTFPPKLKLALHSRSVFMKKVFWKAVQRGASIVAFNAPFDLSRLAVDWGTASDGGWSLTLSQWLNPKTSKLEEDTYRPRIVVKSLNSKTAFISLRFPRPHKQRWPTGRFLDLRTLGWALHNRSYSLKKACKKFNASEQKMNHTPSGRVTKQEIDYLRQDVKCTTALLNAMKQEFDRHPIDLLPEKAYSPATIAKGYLEGMGIVPPLQKFAIPEKIQGIAMQAYYGGRAECRVRRTEVPVVPVDFVSQYATVCTLLGNSELLTAKRLSFVDATNEVRELAKTTTLDRSFDAARWKDFKFFALVRPDKDIFPVRSVYDGRTQNIGSNYLTSEEPIWFAGPDVIAAALETGKAPHIEKAIRIVPHGKQAGLKPISLRGIVEIDPRKEDFFRRVVEERKKFPKDDPMEYFLKIFASSGSYGLFVEVNQKELDESTAVAVFSGEHEHEEPSKEIEEAGRWYSPILGSLIAAGVDNSRFTLVTSFTSKRSEWLNSECVNIFDGEVYHLALQQTAKLDKAIVRTYAHVLYLYTKHPEAKSLAPDGTSCACDTRGLLKRSSVVVASRRYVGKETDRRWEQGEDLSLVEFKSFEYQQSKQVVAGEDLKEDILKIGIRKLERETGVSHHTLDKILKGECIRRKTLAKILKQLRATRPAIEVL